MVWKNLAVGVWSEAVMHIMEGFLPLTHAFLLFSSRSSSAGWNEEGEKYQQREQGDVGPGAGLCAGAAAAPASRRFAVDGRGLRATGLAAPGQG